MRNSVRVRFFTAAIIGLGLIASVVCAQKVLDTWSVEIGGGKFVGSGYITFLDDHTLTGYMATAPIILPQTSMTSTSNNGFFSIDGEWEERGTNHRIGFFTGNPDHTCGPADGTALEATSFSGTVVEKKTKTGSKTQLTMTAETSNGPMQLNGIPPVALTDLDGTSWTAKVVKSTNKVISSSTEIFTLTSSADFPNRYDLDGAGAGFSLTGCALLSAKNTIVLEIQDSNGVFRSVRGKFNPGKGKGSLSGGDSDGAQISMTIKKQ